MTEFYGHLLWVGLFVLALLILGCVVRAVRGPRTEDRLIAVNMMTTLVAAAVCMLAVLLAEGYLADVALVFSLLGGLSVVVLTRLLTDRVSRKSGDRKGASSRVD